MELTITLISGNSKVINIQEEDIDDFDEIIFELFPIIECNPFSIVHEGLKYDTFTLELYNLLLESNDRQITIVIISIPNSFEILFISQLEIPYDHEYVHIYGIYDNEYYVIKLFKNNYDYGSNNAFMQIHKLLIDEIYQDITEDNNNIYIPKSTNDIRDRIFEIDIDNIDDDHFYNDSFYCNIFDFLKEEQGKQAIIFRTHYLTKVKSNIANTYVKNRLKN